MKNEKAKQIISVSIKLLTAIFAIWGVVVCTFAKGFMSGTTTLLYFTIQSNIWLAVADIILAICQIKHIKSGNYALGNRLYIVQQIVTVSITLTGCVFCFVLLPSFMSTGGGNNILTYEQVFLHIVTPLLAIIDFIGFTRHSNFKKIQCLWATIPPFYYLGFATIGYFCNWNFGHGNNFPYFFLNYGSPAGFFGFSDVIPYFMGSFYWIIALIIFVVAVSLIYIAIVNAMIKHNNKKSS